MFRLAYAYLALPFILFTASWLRARYAIPVTGAVLFGLICACFATHENGMSPRLGSRWGVCGCVLMLAAWVFLSGIGSFAYQTSDFEIRNAIFSDLISNRYPVIYHVEAGSSLLPQEPYMLVYYIGYWLPAAMVGKIFGPVAGNLALYVWTLGGISLVFYFIARRLGRLTWTTAMIFIFWGSLYYCGSFLYKLAWALKLHSVAPLVRLVIDDITLWAGTMLYGDCNTGLLYWVFNQTIAPWLVMALLLNRMPRANLLFVYSLAFFQGPFAFLGLFPYVVYESMRFLPLPRRSYPWTSLFNEISAFISYQNALCCLVLSVTALYFSSNSAIAHFAIVPRSVVTYLVFILLSFGCVAMLLWRDNKKDPLFLISIGILLPLPFVQLGYSLDFCARVSIPACFMMMLLVMQQLHAHKKRKRDKMLTLCLLVASFYGVKQITKSGVVVSFSVLGKTDFGRDLATGLSAQSNQGLKYLGTQLRLAEKSSYGLAKSVPSLEELPLSGTVNFKGRIESSFFYEHLARQNLTIKSAAAGQTK